MMDDISRSVAIERRTSRCLRQSGAAVPCRWYPIGETRALVYLWRGSLMAPIVMHFLQDFLSFVLSPLLGLK